MYLALIITCAGLTGCAQVQPWERNVLAKPQMALNPHPLQSTIRTHNLSSREAAAIVNSSGSGGGCGCY